VIELWISCLSYARAEQIHGTGLRDMDASEYEKLHQRKVIRVKPNAIANERKKLERVQSRSDVLESFDFVDQVKTLEDEIQVEVGGEPPQFFPPNFPENAQTSLRTTSGLESYQLNRALPTKVDNSLLASFPPIGDQGQEGACASFATTYYQLSHETCLARQCNNKNGNNTIFSPKWTYNMVNGGGDNGSTFSDAYSVLSSHGAVSIVKFPYVAGDYLTWDMNPNDWKEAISFRSNPMVYLSSIDTPQGLANLKQLLANGHVLVYATYINSWVMSTIGTDPTPGVLSPYAGQQAAMYMDGTDGGHAMTIVGYDDSVWIDINGNGKVDPGEKGAFKIANSWGSQWGNDGFVWIAYDAMGAKSTVDNAPAAFHRGSIFWNASVYQMTAQTSYVPKVLAQFTISTSNRGAMALQLGTSPNGSKAPTQAWTPGMMNSQGGHYGFSGTSKAVSGTFYLDFTDLVAANTVSSGSAAGTTPVMNYYLLAKNEDASTSLLVKDFRLMNVQSGAITKFKGKLPQSINPSIGGLSILFKLN